jgi:hypothetical protein
MIAQGKTGCGWMTSARKTYIFVGGYCIAATTYGVIYDCCGICNMGQRLELASDNTNVPISKEPIKSLHGTCFRTFVFLLRLLVISTISSKITPITPLTAMADVFIIAAL